MEKNDFQDSNLPSSHDVVNVLTAGVKCEFDEEDLKELRSDMHKTILPVGIQSPPRNFGSKSHGKLKADQWRVFAAISGPITFIRLWAGLESQHRKFKLLHHFMSLSNAIHLASQRTQTGESVDVFEQHLLAYLRAIPKLFKEKKAIVPNHHMALHLPQCFREFGPAHSWWTYPSERINGKLQKMKTNSLISKS
jgi:hypothetical protein